MNTSSPAPSSPTVKEEQRVRHLSDDGKDGERLKEWVGPLQAEPSLPRAAPAVTF